MIQNDHLIALKVKPDPYKSPESKGRFQGKITEISQNAVKGLEMRGKHWKSSELTIFDL